MKASIIIISLIFSLFHINIAYGQSSNSAGKTVKQKAHDKELNKEDYITTDDKHFYISIYTTAKKSYTGRTHHWFLDLTDLEGSPLNYAKIKLKGYLKSDPNVTFNYINPVFSLCNEGKYVIGFVNVDQSGPWVLEAEIESKEIKDAFTYEVLIAEKE